MMTLRHQLATALYIFYFFETFFGCADIRVLQEFIDDLRAI
jgi:hypothetical protein